MSDDQAFTPFAALLTVIADPAGCGARLRDLQQKTAEARKAAAELADAELEAEIANNKSVAELDKQAKRLAERELALHARANDLAAKQSAISETYRAIRVIEDQIKRAIMRHAGLLESFNERLQSLPTWDALNRLIGVPVDIHTDAPPAKSTELVQHDWNGDAFTAGSTLTRAAPMSEQDSLPMPRSPDASARSRRDARRAADRRVVP
jgi:hypothetical protein